MLWRRPVTAQAVVAWQAAPDAVAAALAAEGVPAAVGAAEGGWTRARLLVHGDAVVEPRGRTVLDLLDDLARTLAATAATVLVEDWGGRELLVVAPGQRVAAARIPAVSATEAPERAAWADVLRALGNLGALEPVLAAAAPPAPLTKKQWAAAAMSDRRPRAVAHAAGLPPALFDPGAVAGDGIEREVVLVRGADPADVDVVAGVMGVPLQAAQLDGVTAVTTEPIEGRQITPVAAALGSRRRPALLLWRQGDARGYQVVAGSDVLDSHVWDTDWRVVPLDQDLEPDFRRELDEALAPAFGDVEVLVKHAAAHTDVDVVHARTLLRRPPSGVVLQELCAALGLDVRAAEVVEGTREFRALPGARVVEVASGARAVWAAARAPRDSDPAIVRAGRTKPWWWRVLDVVWVVAALAWAAQLWPDGSAVARTAAVVLALTAAWSLYDALTPGTAAQTSPPPTGADA